MSKKQKPASILKGYLKKLHLKTILENYESIAERSAKEDLSYEGFLLEVMEEESQVRRNKRIERLRKQSGLDSEKTFETFDLKRMPRVINQQLSHIRTGTFVKHKENILIFGSYGSGKSHLINAIGHELIEQERKVYCARCDILVQELLQAKQQLTLPQMLKKLSRFDVIIIDDIGYVQQSRDEMEVLFTLLAEKYERGSVLITSNLPFSKWEKIFKDPMVAAAAIDRLVHHSIIMEFNLTSYRMLQAKKRKNTKVKEKGGEEN